MSTDPVNIPPAEAALLRELNQLRTDLTKRHDEIAVRLDQRHAETDKRIEERHEEVDKRLKAILEQATTTNGRLRKAELWIAGLKALGAFLVLLIPFAVVYLNNL